MTEQEVEQYLMEALEFAADLKDFAGEDAPTYIGTLEEGGFLTRDRGLHLKYADGSEWTVGVTCYRRPREEKGGDGQ